MESKRIEPHPESTSGTISKLTEAIDLINREIQSIKQVLQGNQSMLQIKTRFQNAIDRNNSGTEDIEMCEPSSQCESLSQGLSTPQSKSLGTPVVLGDDFPSTPTLEQLGLSGPALSIVGGRRLGFDSSASISDAEFDTSFYQKYHHIFINYL